MVHLSGSYTHVFSCYRVPTNPRRASSKAFGRLSVGDKAGGDSPGKLQQGNRKTRGRKEAKETHKDEISHQNTQNILSMGADHKHGRGTKTVAVLSPSVTPLLAR